MVAVYPGSFDPLTLGHIHIIERCQRIFDRLDILLPENIKKEYWFSRAERLSLVQEAVSSYEGVKVASWQGLTVDYLQKVGSRIIVRGLRTAHDLAHEEEIFYVNRSLSSHIETFYLFSDLEYRTCSSSLVRELYHFGKSVSQVVPPAVERALLKRRSES